MEFFIIMVFRQWGNDVPLDKHPPRHQAGLQDSLHEVLPKFCYYKRSLMKSLGDLIYDGATRNG